MGAKAGGDLSLPSLQSSSQKTGRRKDDKLQRGGSRAVINECLLYCRNAS